MMKLNKVSIGFALFFVISSLFLTYTAVSVEVTHVNYTDNFRTIEWGKHIQAFDNMQFVKSGKTNIGEIKVYRNTTESLNYDGIKLSDIEYGFNNDKLYYIALKTTGPDNWKELKENTLAKYGQDYRKVEDFGYQNYVWDKTNSTVALEYKPRQGSSVVLLMLSK